MIGPLIQNELNEKMRSTMNEWLILISQRLKLQNETLFQAILIIDRYLAKQQVKKRAYQAVAITALFMAAKHEEIYPPDVGTFSYVTKHSVSDEEILGLECDILVALDFLIKTKDRLGYFQVIA